jgi:hypothetical protein
MSQSCSFNYGVVASNLIQFPWVEPMMMGTPIGVEQVECFTYSPVYHMAQYEAQQYFTPTQGYHVEVMPSQQKPTTVARATRTSSHQYWQLRSEMAQFLRVLLRTQHSRSRSITAVYSALQLKFSQEDLQCVKIHKRGDALRVLEEMGFAVSRTHKVDAEGNKYDCNATVALREVNPRLEQYITERVEALLQQCEQSGYAATPSVLLHDLLGEAAFMGDSDTLLLLLEDAISSPTRRTMAGFTIERFKAAHDPYAVVVVATDNWRARLNVIPTTMDINSNNESA